jgi:hypothetical protein
VRQDARLILLPVRVEDGMVTYHYEDHAGVAPAPIAEQD